MHIHVMMQGCKLFGIMCDACANMRAPGLQVLYRSFIEDKIHYLSLDHKQYNEKCAMQQRVMTSMVMSLNLALAERT